MGVHQFTLVVTLICMITVSYADYGSPPSYRSYEPEPSQYEPQSNYPTPPHPPSRAYYPRPSNYRGSSYPGSSSYNPTPSYGGSYIRTPSYGGSNNPTPSYGGSYNPTPSYGGSYNPTPSYGRSYNPSPSYGGSSSQQSSSGSYNPYNAGGSQYGYPSPVSNECYLRPGSSPRTFINGNREFECPVNEIYFATICGCNHDPNAPVQPVSYTPSQASYVYRRK